MEQISKHLASMWILSCPKTRGNQVTRSASSEIIPNSGTQCYKILKGLSFLLCCGFLSAKDCFLNPIRYSEIFLNDNKLWGQWYTVRKWLWSLNCWFFIILCSIEEDDAWTHWLVIFNHDSKDCTNQLGKCSLSVNVFFR